MRRLKFRKRRAEELRRVSMFRLVLRAGAFLLLRRALKETATSGQRDQNRTAWS